MRIAYVSQYFPPEIGAPAARVHEFSREWVASGHDVAVVTAFAHHPTGIKAPEDRRVLTRRENVDGIEVIRTYVRAAPNKGTVKRMISYASFMASAATIGRMRLPRPDIVVGTSPQLLAGVAGYAIARTMRVPFVFEVRDLWPESLLAVGAAQRENVLVGGLRRVADHLYRHSEGLVTVGEGYRRKIHELYAVPVERMRIIHNGIDTTLFQPGPRDNDVRREYGWGDKFVVMYLGTHGMAHALHKVLEVAGRMRGEDILFAFVGEGAEKEKLVAQADSMRLDNVQFIGAQPKARVPQFYAACDLGLVTLRDTPLFQEVLPSKIFEYLGMARPILISVAGEAQRLVEAANGGMFVPPEDVEAMVQAIRKMRASPERRKRMGEQGRSYVVENFDRRVLARRYLTLLEDVVERARRPTRDEG